MLSSRSSRDRSTALLDSIRHPSPRTRNRQMSLNESSDQVIDIRLPAQPLPISDQDQDQRSVFTSIVPSSASPSPSTTTVPNRRRSSFSLRSSVRNLSFIRSSRLCYSSDSAFTDSIAEHRPVGSPRNMNISSPISVTLGRDVESIPRQPLPHSPSPNPVTLVRTPSEAVRKILSHKTPGPDRHIHRSPRPPIPAQARPQLAISSRNFNSTPDLAGARHFGGDPKLYPVSSRTSPLLPAPVLNSHARSGSSLDLAHPRLPARRPDPNRSRQPLVTTALSPGPAHSPGAEVASYQAWAARASPTLSPPAAHPPPPGTAITTPDTNYSASPQSSPDRQASKGSRTVSGTSSSAVDRARLKPLFTPHIEIGKTPAVVLRRKPPPGPAPPHPPPPGGLSPRPPSTSPHPPTLTIPATKPLKTEQHRFVARLLAPLTPGAPPPTILSLNVGGKVFMTAIENVLGRPSLLADFLTRQLSYTSRLSLEAVGTGGVRIVRSWRAGDEQQPDSTKTSNSLTKVQQDEHWIHERNGQKVTTGFNSPISERSSSELDHDEDDHHIKPIIVQPLTQKSTGSWASTKVEGGGTGTAEGVLEVFLDRDPGPYKTLMGYWRHSYRLDSRTSDDVEEEAKWLGIERES